MRLLVSAIGLLLSFKLLNAVATDVTILWSPPAANVDGTSPALYEGFNIYRGTIATFTGLAPLAGGPGHAIAANMLSFTDLNVPDGTYYYWVTAWHCDAAGCAVSAPAGPVSTTIKTTPPVKGGPKVPGVPGTIKITVTGAAP